MKQAAKGIKMKAKIVYLTMALVLVFSLAAALPPASPSPVSAQENLIQNPGFEEPDGCGETPDNWTSTNTSLGRSTDARSGNCSAHITGADSSYTQTVAIEAITLGRFAVYMKASEATAKVEIRIRDSDGKDLLGPVVLSTNQTVWEKNIGCLGTPGTAFEAVIKLEMTPEGSNPEAWFDDILLETADGCFIATAAYGTSLAEEIDVLRQFRDEYLLTNPAGRLLVSLYYTSSPPLANLISKHEGLRAVIRMALEPITWLCSRITAPPSP